MIPNNKLLSLRFQNDEDQLIKGNSCWRECGVREQSSTTYGSENWYSHYGYQHDSSSRRWDSIHLKIQLYYSWVYV